MGAGAAANPLEPTVAEGLPDSHLLLDYWSQELFLYSLGRLRPSQGNVPPFRCHIWADLPEAALDLLEAAIPGWAPPKVEAAGF